MQEDVFGDGLKLKQPMGCFLTKYSFSLQKTLMDGIWNHVVDYCVVFLSTV